MTNDEIKTIKKGFGHLFEKALSLERVLRGQRTQLNPIEADLFEKMFETITALNNLAEARQRLIEVDEFFKKHPRGMTKKCQLADSDKVNPVVSS